jgi:hypothetical protein
VVPELDGGQDELRIVVDDQAVDGALPGSSAQNAKYDDLRPPALDLSAVAAR